MSDEQPKPEDNPAVDGLLQEYAATDGKPDQELIRRIMAEAEQLPPEAMVRLPPPLPFGLTVKRVVAAAAAVLLVGVGLWSVLRPSVLTRVGEENLQIERHGRQRTAKAGSALYAGDVIIGGWGAVVTLSDGSSVKLDNGARLQLLAPGDDERASLRLEQGRAFFRVTPDEKAFRIDAGIPVSVIGTIFGIDRQPSGTTVAVYGGKVSVGAEGYLLLERGQAAVSLGGNSPLAAEIDANEALGWAREQRWFAQAPLAEVTNWLEQNSDYRFVLDPAVQGEPVSAAIGPQTDIGQAVETLMIGHGFKWRLEQRTIYVTGRQ